MKQKLWGGAFDKGPDELAWSFGQSIASDSVLWRSEIDVSIAHAKMLGATGIIEPKDSAALVEALQTLSDEICFGETTWDDDAEDIHGALEAILRERIGQVADKLHAGRSRNDQIATVVRHWLREQCDSILTEIKGFQIAVLFKAEQHKSDAMPGFTHMQAAQPVTLGFHLMAYVWMLQRDANRFKQLELGLNESPLGAAALAGTSLPVDRHMTSKELGFARPMPNALDATSDRDFIGDALHACATLMQHLSRLSQEMTLWSTPMYGFVKLDQSLTTGSSIMPQKRNPDMAELIRGRSARVIGHWTAFMTMMKALPLGYNRDQQEDKPPLFDAMALCSDSIALSKQMLSTAQFNTERMAAVAGDGFATATGIAEALVKEGYAFRTAHELTGKLVRTCEGKGIRLDELSEEDLDGLPKSILEVTTVEASIASRNSYGGPAPEALDQQIAEARALLAER